MSLLPRTFKQAILQLVLLIAFPIFSIYLPKDFYMLWGLIEGLVICFTMYGLNEGFRVVPNSFKKGVIFALENVTNSGKVEISDNGNILRITITKETTKEKGRVLHLVKKDKGENEND